MIIQAVQRIAILRTAPIIYIETSHEQVDRMLKCEEMELHVR